MAPPWTRTVRLVRVDDHAAHPGEVDDQAVVAERPAGDVVAAAAHRDEEVVGAGELHRGITSAVPRQRTISPGWRSIAAFQILRAAS